MWRQEAARVYNIIILHVRALDAAVRGVRSLREFLIERFWTYCNNCYHESLNNYNLSQSIAQSTS